jgi:hypothetical protein
MNTDVWLGVDNPPRPRSTVDDLADEIACLADGDGLAIRADYGSRVAAELRRRGHRVETHAVEAAAGDPRLAVRIDRDPA